MRAFLAASLLVIAFSTPASAARRCSVDLAPMMNVRFNLSVINENTAEARSSSGQLILSKGGAASVMRTDTSCCSKPARVFVSWRLPDTQLRSLQQALARVLPSIPTEPCLIESFLEPGNGRSTFGPLEITIERGNDLPARLTVVHQDPSAGPTPECPAEVRALDALVRETVMTSGTGVQPLQCLPYGPGSD